MIDLTKEQALSFVERLESGEEFNESGFTFRGQTLASIIRFDGVTEDGHITNNHFSVDVIPVMGNVQNIEVTLEDLKEGLELERR